MVVLITGAGTGLGLALAREFLRQGDRVFCCVFRRSRSARDLLRRYPGRAFVLRTDIRSGFSVRRTARAVRRKTGRLDMLINNAAVYSWERRTDPLEALDFRAMKRLIDTNSLGALRMTACCADLLRSGAGKRLVNISSEAGSLALSWRDREYDYCMSKSALNAATRILKRYLRKDGITVLAVDPGWMRTDIGGPEAGSSPEQAARDIAGLVKRYHPAEGPWYVDRKGDSVPF